MNGQFVGSTMHAAIVALNTQERSGNFFFRYPGLKEAYDITLMDSNARSLEFYRYLEERRERLNMIVVCTGNEEENAKVAREITSFLADDKRPIPVIQCSENGLCVVDPETGLPETISLYSPQVLSPEQLDTGAKLLNHQYHLSEGHTAEEDWGACDYFSRMSCRASVEFADAFLHLTGTSREQAKADGWEFSPEQLDLLAQTEHLRWSAFHYCMGYRAMPEDVFELQAAQIREAKAKGLLPIRLGKDTENKLHACLTGWDELEELADREAAVTGIRKDYQQMDRDNILMIRKLLNEVEHES